MVRRLLANRAAGAGPVRHQQATTPPAMRHMRPPAGGALREVTAIDPSRYRIPRHRNAIQRLGEYHPIPAAPALGNRVSKRGTDREAAVQARAAQQFHDLVSGGGEADGDAARPGTALRADQDGEPTRIAG